MQREVLRNCMGIGGEKIISSYLCTFIPIEVDTYFIQIWRNLLISSMSPKELGAVAEGTNTFSLGCLRICRVLQGVKTRFFLRNRRNSFQFDGVIRFSPIPSID